MVLTLLANEVEILELRHFRPVLVEVCEKEPERLRFVIDKRSVQTTFERQRRRKGAKNPLR